MEDALELKTLRILNNKNAEKIGMEWPQMPNKTKLNLDCHLKHYYPINRAYSAKST